MTDEQKKEAAVYYTELLDMTLRKAVDGAFDLLVLDEIMAVMNYGLVREETVSDDRARAVGGTDFPGGLRVRDPKDQASLRPGDPGARGN